MGANSERTQDAMNPDSSANVYRAISELQTVLTGMIGEARRESRDEHHQVLVHIDKLDERVRKLEAKPERTPWPPMTTADIAGYDRPVFRVTFSDAKRWGIAFAAFAGLVTAVNLAAEFIVHVIELVGFRR